MGWLFGKKKKSRVPFPEPHDGENTLKFPTQPSSDNVIEPNKLKEAAGVMPEVPALPDLPPEPMVPEPVMPEPQVPNVEEVSQPNNTGFPPLKRPFVPGQRIRPEPEVPLYIKVDVYQRILGELESLKHDLSHLHTVNEHLETSEYNEENNFSKLRRNIRVIHDRLLQMDKTLFKTQGE